MSANPPTFVHEREPALRAQLAAMGGNPVDLVEHGPQTVAEFAPNGVDNEALLGAGEWLADVWNSASQEMADMGVEAHPGSTETLLQFYRHGLLFAEGLEGLGDYKQAAALRVQVAAPYMAEIEKVISSKDLMAQLTRHQKRELVSFASDFNGLLRSYAIADPEASATQLLEACVETNAMLRASDDDPRPGEYGFYARIRGAQHESQALDILSVGGTPHAASRFQDMSGIDYVLNGVPIDIKASKSTVAAKCGQRGGEMEWGIHNGVLVIWTHIEDAELGDGFRLSPERAREIYETSFAQAIDAARRDPTVTLITDQGER